MCNFCRFMKTRLHAGKGAFTRVELLAVCAVLLLIALVVAPAAVSSRSDSERLVCFNNLRLAGRAVQMWAGDHNQQTPWRTLVSDGGTKSAGKPGAAWFEFTFLSNELASPKILACPSDLGVVRASDFNQFRQSAYRERALSYTISLDTTPDAPRGWLSGERNLRPDTYGANTCSAGVNDAGTISIGPPSQLPAWTNAVHGELGHVLLLDGSVEFTSTARMRELLLASPADGTSGTIHFLKAR
jgi:competence protein ComGC